jgi:hypothetical protein
MGKTVSLSIVSWIRSNIGSGQDLVTARNEMLGFCSVRKGNIELCLADMIVK